MKLKKNILPVILMAFAAVITLSIALSYSDSPSGGGDDDYYFYDYDAASSSDVLISASDSFTTTASSTTATTAKTVTRVVATTKKTTKTNPPTAATTAAPKTQIEGMYRFDRKVISEPVYETVTDPETGEETEIIKSEPGAAAKKFVSDLESLTFLSFSKDYIVVIGGTTNDSDPDEAVTYSGTKNDLSIKFSLGTFKGKYNGSEIVFDGPEGTKVFFVKP